MILPLPVEFLNKSEILESFPLLDPARIDQNGSQMSATQSTCQQATKSCGSSQKLESPPADNISLLLQKTASSGESANENNNDGIQDQCPIRLKNICFFEIRKDGLNQRSKSERIDSDRTFHKKENFLSDETQAFTQTPQFPSSEEPHLKEITMRYKHEKNKIIFVLSVFKQL